MKVGVLGTGDVGRTLGKGFLTLGHQVMLGARERGNPKVSAWVKESGPNASGGTFAETAAFGDLLVLATPGIVYESVLQAAGAENFRGKVVIDTTNPLDFSKGRPPSLAVGHTDSGGEQLQRALPGARVVKAFNIVGNALMVDPQFPGGPPDMFIAGDDAGAKETVGGILKDFGWEVIDLGGIESSRYLEPMAMVWILHAFQLKKGNHAFKLLRK